MNIKLDTNNVEYLKINGHNASFEDMDSMFESMVKERGIDVKEFSISNKYLRAIVREGGFEYHILEKSKGISNFTYMLGASGSKKQIQCNLPYTVMVVKLQYLNGVYIKKGDRIFHTDEPVKKDLSNKLWKWGLSNVYPGNYICWGKEKLPKIDNQTTYLYMDEWFLGIKNDDLMPKSIMSWSKLKQDEVYDVVLENKNKLNFKLKEVVGLDSF